MTVGRSAGVQHNPLLHAAAIPNFRDYGGYRLAGGGRLRTGHLFRSGMHAMATDEDLAMIDGLGLKAVVDLRSMQEREDNPCRRAPGFDARLHFAPGYRQGRAPHNAAGEAPTAEEVRANLGLAFRQIPFQTPIIAAFSVYFRALATTDGPSLVHCSAGKDRTGIAVALLHAVLGVCMEDVMADFLLSNPACATEASMRTLGPTVRKNFGDQMVEAAVVAALSVEPDYLLGMFKSIEERCGSIDIYVSQRLGVTSSDKEAIRERLTTSA